jgi:CxxC motif-containing protein (DUF1111 family)
MLPRVERVARPARGDARRAVLLAAVIGAAAAAGCSAEDPARPAPAAAAGGLFAPFGEPLPGTDGAARASFDRGRAVALRRFSPAEGVGPEYNAVSCGGCHEKPVTGGNASRYRTVFVATGIEGSFVVPFERRFTVDSVTLTREGRPTTARLPVPFFGAGLLAEIPPEEIIAHADPSDADGDGVRGKTNFERGFVGRFGRKAQMASLQGFVRLALKDHLGVTTTPVATSFLTLPPGPVELPTTDLDGRPDPELAQDDLSDLLAFVGLLAPPPPDALSPDARAGEGAFAGCRCTSCHVPSLEGPRGPVFAYSDLLLHDLGPGLADGVSVGEAGASDFRTQPLWGIAAAGPYLHDGRADTLDEAIRAHGGEADRAARCYEGLPDGERRGVVAFLHALGGSAENPAGLLRPGALVPPPGTFGGPDAELDAAEAARFERGRRVFDRDFPRAEGLGPSFNGDACRSCHFDPVFGGAGPSDVDVIRYGRWTDGGFLAPRSGNTVAPAFEIAGGRPLFEPDANLFERRQTPAIFGLGLVETIADEAILARVDPDDRDGDGIRGVASVLPDGRLGRFGWKGHAATLLDFTLDALATEIGLKDELPRDALDDLVFFLQRLGPPPQAPVDAAGASVFASMRCDRCHTPEMTARDGRRVRLFSDLLLHDVAPAESRFVFQGSARGFRTPPLWGVAATPPYLHDGAATTLEEAVARHDGEAAASRDLFASATAAERAALIAFLRGL